MAATVRCCPALDVEHAFGHGRVGEYSRAGKRYRRSGDFDVDCWLPPSRHGDYVAVEKGH
jgi:hypothetical protein